MEKKDWFKDRGYPHFSSRTPSSVKDRILEYISNPAKISVHKFHPLILKRLSQRRYKLCAYNEGVRRSHKTIKNHITASNTKIREILYSTHIDAHIYSYYAQEIIAVEYEKYLKNNSSVSTSISAYRQIPTTCKSKFKNNAHFAKDVFDEIKLRKNCVALAFDIENFFPSLNHRLLKLVWAKVLGYKSLPPDHFNLFKAVTRFSYVRLDDLKTKYKNFDEKKLSKLKRSGKNTFFETIDDLLNSDVIIYKNQKKSRDKLVGIPQGLPISALLANIYMLPFDEAIIEELSEKHNVFYRRYSDDIIVVCDAAQIAFVENFIREQIEKIQLVISIAKTEITHFMINDSRLQCYRMHQGVLKENIPLNYLGFEFYGYQTLLKSKNLAGFYRSMKGSVRRKYKRTEIIKEKYLRDSAPLFKRKIYRLYSFKGQQSRLIPSSKTTFQQGKMVVSKFDRKYRGNYIRYVYRAAEEMEAPEIKRQVRNHWRILQRTLQKYGFQNFHEQSVKQKF